ncbi:MAG TPA: DinB family protein [Candidatus Limnocylindrales bacterium]|nr:DinB family protein [Candidatus Limnocylindrales bacterium]
MAQQTPVKDGATRAAEMVEANAELVEFVGTCSDEEWGRVCTPEGWSVAVVAHHIAWGHEVAAGWIRTIREGRDVPGSPAEHDAGNGRKAAEVAGISRGEVIELANRNIAELTQLLRSLTEADFARSAEFGPGGGAEMSVGRLAGARGHLDRHLNNMREAVGR